MTSVLLPLLIVATVAGGWLYTQWPALQERKKAAREVAQQRVQDEADAARAEQEARRELVREDPDKALPTVINALGPARMAADDREARAAVARAQKETNDAQRELTRAEKAVPRWYWHPVLRFLVLAAGPAAVAVLIAKVAFDWMMLRPITGPAVAVILAALIPIMLLVAAGLVSYGLGWHTDGARTVTQRAITFAGVAMATALLVAIFVLSPLRTLESHQADIAAKQATVTSLSLAQQESPDEITDEPIAAARDELEAAHAAAASDAQVQRFFGVGLGVAEIVLAEVALLGLTAVPLIRAQRRLARAQQDQARAEAEQAQTDRAKRQRVEQVATTTLEYLQQSGVEDARGQTLQLIADVAIISAAVDTADLNYASTALESGPSEEGAVPSSGDSEPEPDTTASTTAAPVPEDSPFAFMEPEAPHGPGTCPPDLPPIPDLPKRRPGVLDHDSEIDDFDVSA